MATITVPGGGGPIHTFTFSSGSGFTAQENAISAELLSQQIDNITGPTMVIGDTGATTPFALTSGLDGLYFISGLNSVGGAISIEGGANTLIGGELGKPGGLDGNWNIGTLGGETLVQFGSGADTFNSGGADTVLAGGANVLVQVTAPNVQGTVIDPASGFVTFLGGHSGGAHILPGGTGGGVYQLGTGGNNVAFAGTGNTTLIGGGDGDVLYANTVTGAQGTTLFASGGAETLVGGGVGTDTFYGFSSVSGGGNVLMDVSAAQSGQVLWLGGGNDTIMLSAGADSVVASALPSAGDDQLLGWNVTQDVLYLDNLTAQSFQDSAAGLRATLSDGTSITFIGLHDQSAINIVFGKPG